MAEGSAGEDMASVWTLRSPLWVRFAGLERRWAFLAVNPSLAEEGQGLKGRT